MKYKLIKFLKISISIAAAVTSSILQAQEMDYRTSLEEALRAFHSGLRNESVELKKDALKSILPSKTDLEFLFPKDAESLWPRMESYYQKMLVHVDEVAAQIVAKPILDIKVIDVRKEDEKKKVYKEVFAMIPENIPVYRVVIKTATGNSGSSTYLFIGERWIHFRGLESVPEMIEAFRTKSSGQQGGI